MDPCHVSRANVFFLRRKQTEEEEEAMRVDEEDNGDGDGDADGEGESGGGPPPPPPPPPPPGPPPAAEVFVAYQTIVLYVTVVKDSAPALDALKKNRLVGSGFQIVGGGGVCGAGWSFTWSLSRVAYGDGGSVSVRFWRW